MSCKVIVIGSGVVGTSIGLHLAEQGAHVVLVERDPHPRGASSASFASVSAMDEPSKDLYLLKAQSLSAWRSLVKRLALPGVHFGGEIRWAEDPSSARKLEQIVDRALSRGYPVRRVFRDELTKLLPTARPQGVGFASYAPMDAHVDPVAVVRRMRDALQSLGGKFVQGRASLRVDPAGLEVKAGDTTLEADTIVLATGAETAAFTGQLGWEIPMTPSPGLLTLTCPIETITSATVYIYPSSGAPIHLRQRDDGRVLIGERTQDWVAEHPTDAHARMLVQQAARSFPQLKAAEVEHFSLEWRPMPSDRLPIIGSAPGLPALYFAVMHSGVTLAPAVGKLVASEVADQRPQPRLEPFRPDRFASRRLEIERDVEEIFARDAM